MVNPPRIVYVVRRWLSPVAEPFCCTARPLNAARLLHGGHGTGPWTT